VTAFIALAALMVVGALLAVLPPLLARRGAEVSDRDTTNIALLRRELEINDADLQAGTIDRNQWESTRREIERRVVEENQTSDSAQPVVAAIEHSPRVALLLALVLPTAAIGLYIALGEPRALSGVPAVAAQTEGHSVGNEQMAAMAASLAKRLEAAPENAEGWVMLARTYAFLGRKDDALNAFAQAMQRNPKDARLLADYADFYAATKGGGSLVGEPEKLIRRALVLDPNQPKALALSGTIAFQNKDFAAAARDWKRALSVLPPDSGFAKQLAAGLAETRVALGQHEQTGPPPARASSSGSSSGGSSNGAASRGGASSAGALSVSGTVAIAPDLAARASPDDTLFVFARTPEGGGPPLAVMRAKVSQLPLKFTLDDSMAMSPQNMLSSASRVVIAARIAKSGGVVPQPGDLEGASKTVAPGAAGVAVLIDKAR